PASHRVRRDIPDFISDARSRVAPEPSRSPQQAPVMCGIAGFQAFGEGASEAMNRSVRRMTDVLEKRGPDSEGFWIDPQQGIALGHRRLSIVELSPLGHQPMMSASGRSVIVYNGE